MAVDPGLTHTAVTRETPHPEEEKKTPAQAGVWSCHGCRGTLYVDEPAASPRRLQGADSVVWAACCQAGCINSGHFYAERREVSFEHREKEGAKRPDIEPTGVPKAGVVS